MSIERRGENKWRFRVRKDGLNYTMNFYGTEKEAKKAHDAFKVDIDRDNIGINENIGFDKLTQLIQDEYLINLTASTQKLYQTFCINHFIPYFGNMPVNKIKGIHIQQFINKLNLSDGSVVTAFKELNKTFNKAIEWGLIKDNPCTNIKVQKPKKKLYSELISTEELKVLFNAVDSMEDERIKLAISIALYCGLRQAEILGLTVDDIDFKGNTIKVDKQKGNIMVDGKMQRGITDTKTENSIRLVHAPEFIIKMIKDYVGRQKIVSLEKHIFINQRSQKILSREWLSKQFKIMLMENNLPDIRFHDLRHIYATMMLNAGINVVTVAQNLGDTIETVLNNYTHGIEDVRKKSVVQLETFISNIKAK